MRITTAYLITPDQQVACVAYDFSTGRRGSTEGVELVVLEHHLLLVAFPNIELARAGNGGNVEVGKVVLVV